MCAVSTISDFYRHPTEPINWQTSPNTYLDLAWTTETFADFKKILELVRKLDTKLNLLDCGDQAKQAWMKSIEKRLAKLEK